MLAFLKNTANCSGYPTVRDRVLLRRLSAALLFASSLALPIRAAEPGYVVQFAGQALPVLERYRDWAAKRDRNRDRILTLEELRDAADPKIPVEVDFDEAALASAQRISGSLSVHRQGYATLEAIGEALDALARQHPQDLEVLTLGQSVEGRPIWAARSRSANPAQDPKVLVVAQLHAREWATHRVALQLLHELLSDPAWSEYRTNHEVWFVPLANPDGYTYSRDHDPDWRKNRRAGGTSVVGVDLNRNFAANFRPDGDTAESSKDDSGASDNPQSGIYRGPAPASEPETRLIQTLVRLPRMTGVLDLHSFGCRVLIPDNPNKVGEERYRKIGAAMLEGLGPDYRVIQYRDLYPMSGFLGAYADQHNLPGITLELGKAFQPDPAKLPEVVERAVAGAGAFLRALDR